MSKFDRENDGEGTMSTERHYFTRDETYSLTEHFKCGAAMANRDAARADMHKRAGNVNRGELASGEVTTAYTLGYSGCVDVPALYGGATDALLLPSVGVHTALGYRVAGPWRARAAKIVARGQDGAELAAQWLEEVRRADEAMAKGVSYVYTAAD